MPKIEEWRAAALKHCLWMAARDAEYAQWAADEAERLAGGLLDGLADKVRAAIEKHTRARKGLQREVHS
jgi:hypothetical protein